MAIKTIDQVISKIEQVAKEKGLNVKFSQSNKTLRKSVSSIVFHHGEFKRKTSDNVIDYFEFDSALNVGSTLKSKRGIAMLKALDFIEFYNIA